MGFTRPYYNTAAAINTQSRIFEKTIISEAHSSNVAKSSSSSTSSRLCFSPKSSQASNYTNQSKRCNHRPIIKPIKMLSTIFAILLMTIKPVEAATTTTSVMMTGQQTKMVLLLWFNNLMETLSTFLTSATTFATTSLIPTLTPSPSSTITARPTYQLTKILFLRTLALVHLAAFSIAKFQNKGLIGDNGIAPARHVLNDSEERQRQRSARRQEWVEDRKHYNHQGSWIKNAVLDSRIMTYIRDKFWYRTDRANRLLPSALWLANDRTKLNPWLDNLSNIGLILSSLMLITGSANVFLILALWWIQRSFMSVGGVFYGYGWEPQLAELSFHAMFLVPFVSMGVLGGSSMLNNGSGGGVIAVPTLVIWAIRFYLFKIMLGAGLIKIKSSDMKWKPGNMSTMYYFYETQPVPNPFSKYFHFMPKAWHRFEVWMNHFVELIAPFLLIAPFRTWRIGGAMVQIMFQLILITSGNLSFLNWLTIVPAILCLDDAFLMNNLPVLAQKVLIGTPTTISPSLVTSLQSSGSIQVLPTPMSRKIVSAAFFLLMAKLNVNVVKNLLSRRQLMNASFDKLRLAGSYGAFGVVCEEREELIIESATDPNGPWKEYDFKVKPGNTDRKPRWISPYHYRLDWQMWIAAQTGRIERNPWMLSFLLKLLQQEKDVVDLLESDPWAESGVSPKYIRVDKYKYSFNKKNAENKSSSYWERERIGRYFPYGQGVLTEEMLKDIIKGLR